MDYIQLSFFGKMSPERLEATGAGILGPCLKKSQKPEFQCLLVENGRKPEWLELGELKSLGGKWTHNIGEFPNVERESFLWEILEDNAPRKYSLSAKACLGILKRAERKKRDLPPILENVLKVQAGITEPETVNCNAFMN